MMFLEPKNTACTSLEIKKSRFISYAKKISSRQEALAYLADLKAQYPDANHLCWGYLIGDPQNSTHAACCDDGEPSGTAGKPILSQIQYANIGNIILVSVRYFGGIRLGAGGLVRAYRESAQQVLQALETQIYTPFISIKITCPFNEESLLRKQLTSLSAQITDAYYTDQVEILTKLPESALESLQTHLATLNAEIIDPKP